MEKRIVVSRKALPTRSPISLTVLGWLAMDYWSAPVWAYGVGATFAAIWFVAWVGAFFFEEQQDPFHGG